MKGLEAPVRVWRVRSLFRANEGRVRTAFVGRHAELAQFSGVAETCRTAGIGQMIIVRGEAGIGKTRLVEEFVRRAAVPSLFYQAPRRPPQQALERFGRAVAASELPAAAMFRRACWPAA